jgi:aerobic carbon-monoxide dehydrogenase large subunit
MGQRIKRIEDPRLLSVGGTYVADVELPPGALHVAFVRSPAAHARILSVDVEEARHAPGVVDVITASDIDLADLAPPFRVLNQLMRRPLLARDVVRFAGEPVAAVVAATVAEAVDATELVIVDY